MTLQLCQHNSTMNFLENSPLYSWATSLRFLRASFKDLFFFVLNVPSLLPFELLILHANWRLVTSSCIEMKQLLFDAPPLGSNHCGQYDFVCSADFSCFPPSFYRWVESVHYNDVIFLSSEDQLSSPLICFNRNCSKSATYFEDDIFPPFFFGSLSFPFSHQGRLHQDQVNYPWNAFRVTASDGA